MKASMKIVKKLLTYEAPSANFVLRFARMCEGTISLLHTAKVSAGYKQEIRTNVEGK